VEVAPADDEQDEQEVHPETGDWVAAVAVAGDEKEEGHPDSGD